jgi:hypothetical protein
MPQEASCLRGSGINAEEVACGCNLSQLSISVAVCTYNGERLLNNNATWPTNAIA